MTPMEDGTFVKLIGDVSEELPEATYRVIAKNLREKIFNILVELAHDASHTKDISGREAIEAIERVLAHPQARVFGELAIGFIVSAILEFAPSEAPLLDLRRKLAYNLRVQSYQDVGDAGLNKLIQVWQRSGSELRTEIDLRLKELATLQEQIRAPRKAKRQPVARAG
jgi:hypothetical protein